MGDAPMPELLAQIPAEESVASVSARGAQAVIPPRLNAQPWKAHKPAAASRK